MGTSIVRELTADERARMTVARQEMEAAGSQGCATRFTFFAAFDGTNNDRDRPKLSGDDLPTNIGQLSWQSEDSAKTNAGIHPGYYPGVGTGGDQGGLAQAAVLPTSAIHAAAEKAYAEFRRAALEHLDTPGATVADLGAAVAGFSRGGASAIRFAQLLGERGLVAPDGQVLAAPGTVPVTAMALIDPVARFVDAPMHIPPNVQGQVLSVIAEHENRSDFRPVYQAGDPRVSHVHHPGNHVGNGGGYDQQGTAANVLEGVTGYFQQRGVALAEVPPELRHDPQAPQRLYTEVWQTARNGDVMQHGDGSPQAAWRYDNPALGRIGVLPRVPPGHEAWLDKFQAQVGEALEARGHSAPACERIGAGCVCRAAGHSPAPEPPHFMLSRDGQQVGVLHRSGVLQEMDMQRLLTEPAPPVRDAEAPAMMREHHPAMATPPAPAHEPLSLAR